MMLLIFTLLVALLVAIFAVQNAAPVAINLFWIVAEVPLVLVILGSVLAGAIIVFLIAIWREFRLKRKVKAEVKSKAEAEAEAEVKPEAKPEVEPEVKSEDKPCVENKL